MRYLCCHSESSESITDVPTLRICFAVKVKTLGTARTRWKCQEYQIRFQNSVHWRCAFDHVPDTLLAECDGEVLKSHWSLSTTQSNSSSGTACASGRSRFRKNNSTKKSAPSGSVKRRRRPSSKHTDSSEHSQQLASHSQSQQHSADQSVEGAAEEKRRHRKDAYERLDRKSKEKHDGICNRLMSLLFRSKPGRKSSQPQRETPKHQGWAKLCELIHHGLDAQARGFSALVTEEQEAFLLPVSQRGDAFEVDLRQATRDAMIIDDVEAAMREMEARNWRDVVIFVRDADTPWEQTEWQMMEEPRVLYWAPFRD